MPVSERATAGNDLTILIVSNSLELPYPVDKLQVAHMITLVNQDTINAVIKLAERQFMQYISPFSYRRHRQR